MQRERGRGKKSNRITMYTSIHWLRFVNEIKRRDVRPSSRGCKKRREERSLGAIRLGNFRRPLSRMAAVWGARLEEMTRRKKEEKGGRGRRRRGDVGARQEHREETTVEERRGPGKRTTVERRDGQKEAENVWRGIFLWTVEQPPCDYPGRGGIYE